MKCLGTVVVTDGDSFNFGDYTDSSHNKSFEKAIDENSKFSYLRNIYIDKSLEFFSKAFMMAKNKILTMCNATPYQKDKQYECDTVLIYAPDVLTEKQYDFLGNYYKDLSKIKTVMVCVIHEDSFEESTLKDYLENVKSDKLENKHLQKRM